MKSKKKRAGKGHKPLSMDQLFKYGFFESAVSCIEDTIERSRVPVATRGSTIGQMLSDGTVVTAQVLRENGPQKAAKIIREEGARMHEDIVETLEPR